MANKVSAKTKEAVVRAAMISYKSWAKNYPVAHAYVIAKNKAGYAMNEASADLIRACHAHAHAKSTKARSTFTRGSIV